MLRISRRNFLVAGTLLGVQAMGATNTRPFFRRTGLPIGLQLYTLGEDLKRDFDGTLAAVSKIGYRTVELAGLAEHSAADWRQALDRAQLKCPSIHVPPHSKTGVNLDELGALAEVAHALGIGTVVCPMFNFPERFSLQPQPGEDTGKMLARLGASMTLDDWKWNAEQFDKIGAQIKKAGLQLGYHNHNFEWTSFNGVTGYDEFLRLTDPELVKLELDCGWATVAGQDPAAYLTKYPDRYRLLHIKDFKHGFTPRTTLMDNGPGAPVPTELGRGAIDYRKIFVAAQKAGIRALFVEQEPPFTEMPALEAIKVDFDYMKNLKS
jgi:sugar phosphate isomerase/epimerase